MLFIHCNVGVVGHFYLFMSTPSNDEWNRTDISGLDILPQQYVVFKFYLAGKEADSFKIKSVHNKSFFFGTEIRVFVDLIFFTRVNMKNTYDN